MSSISDEKARVRMIAEILAAGDSPTSWPVATGVVNLSTSQAIGDDCVTLDAEGELTLVWGSDYVRGSKFKLFELGLLNYFDLGYYLVCANLSDIAAMGAKPLGVLSVLRYPPELTDADFAAVITGMREAARMYGADLIGGDTGGAERVILSASALGVCVRGSALVRTGARVGDVVCLSGSVGAPAAAVLYFASRQSDARPPLADDLEAELLVSWQRPSPRVAHGLTLSEGGFATACQDVSDGLRATLRELAAASAVRLMIDATALPIDRAVAPVAAHAGVDPIALALSASVDFELLFTVPRALLTACRAALAAQQLELHEIGVVEAGDGAVLKVPGGSLRELPGVEWRHQQEDVVTVLREGLEPQREA